MKIRLVGAEFFPLKTYGRTDMTKLIVDFQNFTKSAKKMTELYRTYRTTLVGSFFEKFLFDWPTYIMGRDSSVVIATDLRAGRSGDRIPVEGEIFRTCPDRPWSPPSLLYNGYRVFPGGKEWPGRDADPSPPSSAVGHERVELYLCSPYGPYGLYRASVPVQGWPLHI